MTIPGVSIKYPTTGKHRGSPPLDSEADFRWQIFFFCQRTAWHFSWMMHTRDNVLWISFLSPVNKICTHKKSIICKDQCGIAVVISSNLFQLNLLRTQLKITFFLPNIKLLVQWKVESFYVVLISVWCENINRLSFSKILIEVLYLNPI